MLSEDVLRHFFAGSADSMIDYATAKAAFESGSSSRPFANPMGKSIRLQLYTMGGVLKPRIDVDFRLP
jgi:hypothetical protein